MILVGLMTALVSCLVLLTTLPLFGMLSKVVWLVRVELTLCEGALVDKLDEHSHFVQGVAVDPQGVFLATLSCDRTCRLYTIGKHKKYRCVKVLQWLHTETEPANPVSATVCDVEFMIFRDADWK